MAHFAELEEKTDANFGAGVPLTDLSDIPLNEISRSSIITIDPWHDSGNVGGSAPFDVIGLLLEASTQGVFKQEDSSTVTTTHGDDIVLESATTLGVIDKLILESTRIQIEDKINKGTTPFSNYSAKFYVLEVTKILVTIKCNAFNFIKCEISV